VVAHRCVREPGGTPVGDAIRAILLGDQAVSTRAEPLLFMASRAQLIDEVVEPALAAGDWVLADRFFLSTYAYQIAARGLDATVIAQLNSFATGGLVPDLTILLTLPAGAGLSRAAARGADDRIERLGPAFHEQVERAFLEFARPAWQSAHPEVGPLATVDALGTVDEVHHRIVQVLADRFPETFAIDSLSDL
jgi:dTMP kinase